MLAESNPHKDPDVDVLSIYVSRITMVLADRHIHFVAAANTSSV